MIADKLGRLFEVGFNIGILTYIEQHKIQHNFGELYRYDLQNLKFSVILKRILEAENIISDRNIRDIEKWCLFLLQKGFLSGLNFFGEYLKANGWNNGKKNIEILYCQCSFGNQNSINTYTKNEEQEYRDLLSQFGKNLNPDDFDRYIYQYKQKGEFLKADTLILLRYRQNWRILTVDLSIFSVRSVADLLSLEDKELQNQRRLLRREINYLRSKSVFAKLRIDTGANDNLDFAVSENLTRYFTAFKREDKESAKLIQAGSYAESFYRFLRETAILKDDTAVVFNVVGYSDRSINTLCLRPQNLQLLKICSQIYRHEPKEQEINQARTEVLDLIQRNTSRSFTDGKKIVKQLLEIPSDDTSTISHTETIQGFSSTLSLREPHAELIKKALNSQHTYLFLTGNPGIGKTTAIVEFLKAHIDEGFLFFYVSPRKQVNLDIIEKFRSSDPGKLCDDRLFCINTNSQIIEDNFPHSAVKFYSNQYQDDFTKNRIHFIAHTPENQRRLSRQQALKRITDAQIRTTNQRSKGVLSTLCEAIYTVTNSQISNHIVATACIQSLRITANGANTLSHFANIFKDACNKREGKVIASEMQKISRRIKHLFIMIDEITGDASGVEFLNEIGRILRNYELTDGRHGFNTKIIVADASIVDSNVIQQHLSETSPEPDKIFFRRVLSEAVSPLTWQEFRFQFTPAIVINANSYPASSLVVNYRVFLESVRFDEDNLSNRDNLKNTVEAQIIADINQLRSAQNSGQILVYIQDKRRLQELIEKIRHQTGEFVKDRDYLEIHASLSDKDKQDINQSKNRVKIIFMTSSASRGLSFPKAKHILAEIPRFQVESNLMEIIQVIYRGRGLYEEDGVIKTLDEEQKELLFYLSDRAIYYAEEKEISRRESIINILNILLILKTCIMTRIQGYGQIGYDKYLMIPIGGKSLSAAGQTFSGKMANLIKTLKNEHRRRPSHQILEEVYTSLEQLLNSAEFVLSRNSASDRYSYLDLQDFFNDRFSKSISENFANLLQFSPVETGHITGSLLVVPIADRKLEETYEIQLKDIVDRANEELLKKMLTIHLSNEYPESLRSSIHNAIQLLDKLREPTEKTQFIEQNSQRLDQYYALPLFNFISGEAIGKYFADEPEEPEDEKFRDILATYIHHLYPSDKTLPIGYKYRDFPFVVFSSYSLEEMREKIFTDKYLLTSNELNVLNLILSKAE